LAMGYVSHGVRSATNQVALVVVTPEGNRGYVEEYLGVYGTTSAEYRLSFPRNVPVRPLSEFVPNPNGGFEHRGSFLLSVRDDRTWLDGWRLNFWQTRGVAITDCVLLDGPLRATRTGSSISVVNHTSIGFEAVSVAGGGRVHELGPLRASESRQLSIEEEPTVESKGDNLEAQIAKSLEEAGFGSPHSTAPTSKDDIRATPEAEHLLRDVSRRVDPKRRFWVFGITRQPAHRIDSLDSSRSYSVAMYAWPVLEPADSAGADDSVGRD